MSQIDQFLTALKRALKNKQWNYKQVAEALHVSESSVKRLLSNKKISLDRIEKICEATGISFSDVCKLAEWQDEDPYLILSFEQEKLLSENPRLLHYFTLLTEGYKPQKIEKEFQITQAESKKFLFALDKCNLIELHPKDKVKLIKNGLFRFRRDGPVGKVVFQQLKEGYLYSDFKANDEFIRFGMRRLSSAALGKLKAKIEKIYLELEEEANYEMQIENNDKEYGILFAYRPWQYSIMNVLKKKNS
ncbi:helix-turn-helix domain-containing protein [Bdellovibrio sp. HCB337]|uniref:helix-turn-helix domain-containing protein n=1 Tax=Bdellovibrio sp. HCB337 TaxID=3394358 RepID=UPI0039A5A733